MVKAQNCESHELPQETMQCPEHYVIQVEESLYGTPTGYGKGHQCQPSHYGYCSDIKDPTSLAQSQCDGKNSCTFTGNNKHQGDPCGGIRKYTETKYTCIIA